MPIPDLPFELITHIITFITSPADLLSTSLTNRAISTFSLLELNYRFIRTGLSNNALWTHLVTHPDQAAHVRELEISREDASSWRPAEKDLFPIGISVRYEVGYSQHRSLEDVERSERLLIAALCVLVNLEKFSWKCSAPIIIQGNDITLNLLEAEGSDLGIETYEKDVWTALRDHTSLRELKIFDKGPGSSVRSIYSLYKSQMGSIRNITHVEFKIRTRYPTPLDGGADEVEQNDLDSDNDDIDVCVFPLKSIRTSVLRTFLHQCRNLEHLTLAYYPYQPDKNKFTNLTDLFTSTYWPRLSALHLTDVLVDKPTMTQFLIDHSHIRSLSASLSLKDPRHMPENPFLLDPDMLNKQGVIGEFLPELEEVDLPPELAREVLRVVKNLEGLKVVKSLEPCDWGEPKGGMDNHSYIRVERRKEEKEKDKAAARAGVDVNMNLLKKMTNVRVLTVRDLGTDRIELGILANTAPQLEVLKLTGIGLITQLNPFYVEPIHTQLLPDLIKWQHLTSFMGLTLWDGDDKLGTRPESKVVRELAEGCPLLREVTWKSGKPGILVRDKAGKGIEVIEAPHLEDKKEIMW